MIWLFPPRGLCFELSFEVCCVNSILGLSVVKPFQALRRICPSCLKLWGEKVLALAGGFVFLKG